MNYTLLEQSGVKFFTVQKIAEVLNISEASARVLASRYLGKNLFVKPKKNFYILASKSAGLSENDLFCLSSLLQTPSYISFQTALSYYEISTQITRGLVECVNPRRTGFFELAESGFLYSKIKENLYFGFIKADNFFIASPEKALLDTCYFEVFRKYRMDWLSVDFTKFDKVKLKKMAKKFPKKVQMFLTNLFKIYE